MNPKTENLIELIFSKLKKYQAKEISLDKEDLKKFISSLFKNSWIKENQPNPAIVNQHCKFDFV